MVTALAELGIEQEPAPGGFELTTMLISGIDQFAAFRLDKTTAAGRRGRGRMPSEFEKTCGP